MDISIKFYFKNISLRMELNRKKFCQFRKKLTLCRNAAEVAWLLFVNPSYPNSSKDRYEVLVEKKISQFYHARMTQYCCNWDFCVVGWKKKCQTDINQISTLNLRSLLSMLTDFRFDINHVLVYESRLKLGFVQIDILQSHEHFSFSNMSLLQTAPNGHFVYQHTFVQKA